MRTGLKFTMFFSGDYNCIYVREGCWVLVEVFKACLGKFLKLIEVLDSSTSFSNIQEQPSGVS